MSEAVSKVEKSSGYNFRDRALLQSALLHPSHKQAKKNKTDFERLEFLGDSVLGVLVAELLFEMFPDEREGDLAKRKSSLVSRDVLAKVAEKIGIDDELKFSTRTGASTKVQASMLENACEALIGAMFLDGGIEPARTFVHKIWTPLAKKSAAPPKDPKTTLQEWAQGRGMPLPEYIELGRTGSDHSPLFAIEVRVPGFAPVRGTGHNKKSASADAADKMLAVINEKK